MVDPYKKKKEGTLGSFQANPQVSLSLRSSCGWKKPQIGFVTCKSPNES